MRGHAGWSEAALFPWNASFVKSVKQYTSHYGIPLFCVLLSNLLLHKRCERKKARKDRRNILQLRIAINCKEVELKLAGFTLCEKKTYFIMWFQNILVPGSLLWGIQSWSLNIDGKCVRMFLFDLNGCFEIAVLGSGPDLKKYNANLTFQM